MQRNLRNLQVAQFSCKEAGNANSQSLWTLHQSPSQRLVHDGGVGIESQWVPHERVMGVRVLIFSEVMSGRCFWSSVVQRVGSLGASWSSRSNRIRSLSFNERDSWRLRGGGWRAGRLRDCNEPPTGTSHAHASVRQRYSKRQQRREHQSWAWKAGHRRSEDQVGPCHTNWTCQT